MGGTHTQVQKMWGGGTFDIVSPTLQNVGGRVPLSPPQSFRDAKICKIGKKDVFLVTLTNFGKDLTDTLRKMHAKTHISGLFSYLKNMCFRVCFENPFMRMISSLKYRWPPGTLFVILLYDI